MGIISGFTDSTPSGDASSPKTGDLSSAISAGSTEANIRITNTGDFPCFLNWRNIGDTDYNPKFLNPFDSADIWISLTAARTFEYYFDAGVLKVDVTYFFGSVGISTVTVTDVTNWLTMHGYTISASSDLTSAEVQLCIDEITAEVTMAVTRYALIASQTLNSSFKNHVILKGTVAQALYALRNVGATRGLTSDMIIISTETADRYYAVYKEEIERISQGTYYGA